MANTKQLSMELDDKYDKYDYPTTAPEVREGHPGHLTSIQQAQVHQLRELLKKELEAVYESQEEREAVFERRLDTLTLLRFLRARKFDVNKSKDMFIECEKWRKETKLDDTLPNWVFLDPQQKKELFKYYPQYYHKTDKDGRPVYIEQLGSINTTEMAKIVPEAKMLMNLAVEYERLADPRLPAASRKAGVLLETCCTIMDLKGVSIWNAGQVYGYVNKAAAISQNYYPERLGRMYLINAPMGFAGVWSVVKKWLDPVTVAKIHILGSGYQKELLQQVPAENLPKRFGGTCQCPAREGLDPKTDDPCAYSDMGPWQEPEWTRPAWWENTAKAEA